MKVKDQIFEKCVWCGIDLNRNNTEPKNRQYCRRCQHELRNGVYTDYKGGIHRKVVRK